MAAGASNEAVKPLDAAAGIVLVYANAMLSTKTLPSPLQTAVPSTTSSVACSTAAAAAPCKCRKRKSSSSRSRYASGGKVKTVQPSATKNPVP